MGGSNLARIAEELQRHGKPPGTPVAVVHQAQLPGQRTWRGDLAGIAAQCEGQQLSPCIVVVGAVAGGV